MAPNHGDAAHYTVRPFTDVHIRTQRLQMRPLVPTDAEQLYRIYSDSEFMRYWSSAPWTSIEQATSLIERDRRELAAGEHLRLGILLNEDESLIGTCSLFNFNVQSSRAEIGYGIASNHWRRGYMQEAVSALIRFAFTELGLNRIEADIDPRNIASTRSLEKLGFTREGLLRERWIVGGEVSDSALYGLIARDTRSSPANSDA